MADTLAPAKRKRNFKPLIALIALILVVAAIVAFFVFRSRASKPNTLEEKLTGFAGGELYDVSTRYEQDNDGSQGFVWRSGKDKLDRIVFFENGEGYIRRNSKKGLELTDGKNTISTKGREIDFKWEITGKTLFIKDGKHTLLYANVSPRSSDRKLTGRWSVSETELVFNGMEFASGRTTFWQDIQSRFRRTFIIDERWFQFLKGLGMTLEIAFFATLLGLLLGFLTAIVRSTYEMNLKGKKCFKTSDYVGKALNAVANVYITVIRGTPVVVQLMIMYFIIFASSTNGMLAAILSFGINSGAYVAEIMRSGIMSIDRGQFEASRSLGFNYVQTMIHIILPQALKNVLPALGNEFIVLLKETSVAGYVAIQDLTYIGNHVKAASYDVFFPLLTVAFIYLSIVLILNYFLKRFERRLRSSEH